MNVYLVRRVAKILWTWVEITILLHNVLWEIYLDYTLFSLALVEVYTMTANEHGYRKYVYGVIMIILCYFTSRNYYLGLLSKETFPLFLIYLLFVPIGTHDYLLFFF